MCGIIGYIGDHEAQAILLNGLKKLEYRGYDSAGIAVHDGRGLHIRKAKGRISELERRLSEQPVAGSLGIGHTRWATHGKPSDENSHPHSDGRGQFTVVHNGIIENYLELKDMLRKRGVHFVSETDTEVISHLIAELYDGDIAATVRKAMRRMRGAYALAVATEHEPDRLVAVRLASPLIIGVGEGGNLIGSDIPALLDYARDIYILEDGEMAVLTRSHVALYDASDGQPIERGKTRIDWSPEQAEKGGYPHFMLKEIMEQPDALRRTLRGRLDPLARRIALEELTLTAREIRRLDKITIVACGTAYHAGLVGKQLIERLAGIPVEVDIASEYRYRRPLTASHELVIAVSQSGETADTLAALREGKARGARTLTITNAIGSSISREADDTILTLAGPEIAVASTKAYTTQLLAFLLLATAFAQARRTLDEVRRERLLESLERLAEQMEAVLSQTEPLRKYAASLLAEESVFFIGRGPDYAVAMEGSLKLKEISYIHSEAYAAGELKHGTLALIEEGTPVIALATQAELRDKMISNIKEVKARGAVVFAVVTEGDEELLHIADGGLALPAADPLLTPLLTVIPLQLIAYYVSTALGNDVDKPRNLAKSVTVE